MHFTNMRRNLFSGMPNSKLQECYRSYQKCLITRECAGIWSNMIDGYKEFVDCNKYPKLAEAVCEGDMFNEIARRFFKIVNMSDDLCELFGINR